MGQSRKEDQKPTASIVNPKHTTRIGNWNVRTMFETGKAGQVAREMKRYKLDILGISECRWRGSGKSKLNTGEVIIYSGEENIHQGGVAIMMSQQAARCLMEWTPESSRIIRARFYSKYRKLTLIHVYSPTNDASVENKDDFYEQLESTVQKCNRNDILLITGDLNAKVGKGTPEEREILGQHGTGDRNENGERLCEFCEMNGLVITGTIFPHKEIHKATWTSPNGRTKNQIDHTLIAKEFRSSVMDTVVRRGADVGSDHYLVETRLKLKLKGNPRGKKGQGRLDTQKLAAEEMLVKYNVEVRNRFQALEDLEEEENADQMNSRMENIYVGAAKDVLGIAKRTSKPWLSGGTWKKVAERRQLKLKLESTRSERVKQRIRGQYKEKDQEVKRSARKDKRNWMNEMADKAERAAENGRAGELHRIVKTLTGEKKRTSTVVNDKNGRPTNERSERLKIWKEHFDTVLNREPPVSPIQPHEIETMQNDREFDIGAFQPTEVKNAIKSMKSGKAAGHDSVVAELLKTDLEERTKELTKLFNKVKEEGAAPKSWSKGLIVKLTKKGNLRECTNWRGITLLPVISKIFGRVLISRIKKGVDNILRKEQAGFRENRSTIDQIFTLRNILEQVNEWNATLYTHFIDFEKAFDSIHRESLWNIMSMYGIPEELITLVKAMYNNFECAVLEEGETTEWFRVQSGVKQGCPMSGFLFLLSIDWVMNRTTEGRRTGIRWKLTSVLEDLDFADDIALLSSRYVDIKDKTSRLVDEAARVGLKINAKKSKVMRINAKNDQRVKVNDEQVDDVEEFSYLGALLDKEGGATKDIQQRLSKARQTFYRLRRIWDTSEISRKTKVQLFKTIVRAVLMYGCEAWKLTKTEEKKLDAFQYKCMKRILKIRWPQTISHQQIQENTGVNRASDEIRRRRWNWIGHIMRKNREEHCVTALEWRPEGRRRPGRPKTTWRRMVEEERRIAGWQSWTTVRALAANRSAWKDNVKTLCALWHEEI